MYDILYTFIHVDVLMRGGGDKMINIEIKNNIMDFDKLEKYRKYIINNKFRYLFYILTACLILLIIYYCIDAGIFVGFLD